MGQLNATVRLLRGMTSVASSRSHSVLIDRPEENGGADLGFLGGELILAGEGGCFMSNLVAASLARNIELDNVTVEVSGEMSPSPPRFTRILLRVELGNGIEPRVGERLISIAKRACIATNTLSRGTEVAVEHRKR